MGKQTITTYGPILGYKGITTFDAGVIYAPYIPIQINPLHELMSYYQLQNGYWVPGDFPDSIEDYDDGKSACMVSCRGGSSPLGLCPCGPNQRVACVNCLGARINTKEREEYLNSKEFIAHYVL